jgi:hypothetical protein
MSTTCEKSFCEKYFVPMMMRKLKLPKNSKNKLLKECKMGYCNPKCSKTIYQNGKKFPKNVNVPNNKAKLLLEKFRATVFKNKTSVLKNNFYEKLSKKNVKFLKDKGALSGCTLFLLNKKV